MALPTGVPDSQRAKQISMTRSPSAAKGTTKNVTSQAAKAAGVSHGTPHRLSNKGGRR
jgi:hypothetical protein